ncbi:MAG: pyruvate kinase, partial [Gemmatimonadetes bacterium]|nr:pyruvate kinase [Gemmatimonadota bacterium]
MIRTKVIATIGPASAKPETMIGLVRAGIDVARINMSHGDHRAHEHSVRLVREAAETVGRPVAILVDLQGPKIRMGALEEPVLLQDGQIVTIAPEGLHAPGELPTAYTSLAREVTPGTQILLDDGLLELVCVETDGGRAHFEVVRGGMLASRKGINLPGVELNTPAVTGKDLKDLEFAFSMDAEYVGLSFVQRVEDVRVLKARMRGRGWLVAKIERASAVEELDGILEYSDAVMVARGDLGVELPFASVPLVQKRIIQAANGYGCPVITATQMLESMTSYPTPTRAETSDVANAIIDGTDAVMLSGETAVGKYPARTVEVMVRIAEEIEGSGVLAEGPHYQEEMGPVTRRGSSLLQLAVSASTVRSALV